MLDVLMPALGRAGALLARAADAPAVVPPLQGSGALQLTQEQKASHEAGSKGTTHIYLHIHAHQHARAPAPLQPATCVSGSMF